jgi:RecA-family ATPase
VLPVGKVGLLAAPGGVGKSSALAWLALAIATGRPWFGLSIPRPGAVALILGEETSADVLRKLYFGARALHLTADELEAVQQRVFSMGTAGTDVALLQADRQGQLHPSPFAEQLSRDLSEKGPWRAILLDPLSRFSHAETEIDAAAATRTVEALERLSALPGTPAVLVAHHTRKLGRAEGATGDDIRGSSALRDGVRWAAVLEALEAREGDPRLPPQAQGAVRLSVVKSNVGRVPAPAIALREGGGALRDATPGEGRGLVEKAVPSPTRSSRRMDVKNDD